MFLALESDRLAVLAAYGAAVSGLRWSPVPRGGFSGAVVWRGEDESGRPLFALKAWPEDGIEARRLERIHGWMRQAAGLPFVPRVLTTATSATFVEQGGRLWDVEQWMPGTGDFLARPGHSRLVAAFTALSQLHGEWRRGLPARVPCPAVLRRLRLLDEWDARATLGSATLRIPADLMDAVQLGTKVVASHAAAMRRELARWASRPVAVQPCLCDVWHDHVLFTGDAVTGIIDYGAMKEDHVAVDLARLLGDLAGDDDAAFASGLAAYSSAGGILEVPPEFVRVLDRTGTLCGIVVWLRRLVLEAHRDIDAARIRSRMVALCSRFQDGRVSSLSGS